MVENSKLDEDPQGKAVDPTRYCGMTGTLMYLTSNRPDLVFTVCMCARNQAKPTENHLHAVKRIFRYLRGTINMGPWYSKDSCIALTAFVDADHACNISNLRKILILRAMTLEMVTKEVAHDVTAADINIRVRFDELGREGCESGRDEI
ncbi:hypothetical protein Tco_1052287 [Tanacetum coccineum]